MHLSPRLLPVSPTLSRFGGMIKAAKGAALLVAALAPFAGLQAQSTYSTPYTITTLAGSPGTVGFVDGTGSAARFDHPFGVATDGAGNIYVSDSNNSTIRKITSGGVVTTFAGSAGINGSTDGTGIAARFSGPEGLTIDFAGNLYVADSGNCTIRKITPGGVVTTLAGAAGFSGSTDGTGAAARFTFPAGVTSGGAGIYVADTSNHTIRLVTYAGVVTTFAGSANHSGSTDGTGGAARFNMPYGVAVDSSGTVYVADSFNYTIRKITSGGVVTTYAGTAAGAGSADGTGSAAQFYFPRGLAVDGSGNVFVIDSGNCVVRLITSGGVVTTLAGTAGSVGSTDGTGATALFNEAYGIAVDGSDNIVVADTYSSTFRVGTPPVDVHQVLIFKGTEFVQTSAGSPVVDPKAPGPNYGGPYNFNANVSGINLGGITAPVITLPVASTYPTDNPIRHNGGVMAYSTGDQQWNYGVDAGNFGGTSLSYRDTAFAAGDYGMNVLGNSFTMHFPTTSFAPNMPSVTLTGGSWVAGKYVIDVTQDLTLTTNTFTNFNQNADGAMELQVDESTDLFSFYSDDTAAPHFQTFIIPGGTLSAGRDYRGRASFYALMDRPVVGGLPDSLNAAVYAMETQFVISTINAPTPGAKATFYRVGHLNDISNAGNVTSEVRDVTKTGGVIYAVGNSIQYEGSLGSDTAFLWTSTNGMTALPNIVDTGAPNPPFVTAAAITPDAAYIASRTRASTGGNQRHASRVTTSGLTNLDLGTLAGFPVYSAATAISNDGSVLYGFARYNGIGNQLQAVRFTAPSPTITAIPFLNGGDNSSTPAGRGTSSDGTVMIGTSSNLTVSGGNPDAPGNQAFRYLQGTGVSAIPFPAGGTWSQGQAVSPDGNLALIAGNSTAHSNGEIYLRNNSSATTTPLGAPTGYTFPVQSGSMNSDGSLVLAGFSSPSVQFFVHNSSGWHSLVQMMSDAGVTLSGWSFTAIYGMSADGTLVWGGGMHNGNPEGWIVEFNAGYLAGYGLTGDFNQDGHRDIVWQNSTTGDRGFWLMNGTAFGSWVDIGSVPIDWTIAATGDLNGDGKADILWENTTTGERYIWLMNGTGFDSGLSLGVISTDWHIAAVGDFNGDGKNDILWENTVSGDRGFWLMNGTVFASWQDIGIISTALRIVGTADFNGDGKTDIVWENTSTGKRVIWMMNGTTFVSSFNLGIVSTDWHIAALGDYNNDGQTDILWENTVNGDRGFWLMNGTTFSSWVDVGIVTTDWHIAH